MKLVFFGTPDFVVPIVDELYKKFKTAPDDIPIAAIVTQPPRPAGRKKILAYSEVDNWAKKHNIQTFYSADELVKSGIKAQVGVLAAYGEILRKEHLNYFPQGIINIHYSLLPKYRGASPVQASIIAGETQSGITISKMDEELDKGRLITHLKDEITATDTAQSIRKRYSHLTASELPKVLATYLAGKIKLKPLLAHRGTYTKVIKKDDAFIPPKYLSTTLKGYSFQGKWKIPFMSNFAIPVSAISIDRFIRAMQPWPIAWTEVQIQNQKLRLKIHKAHIDKQKTNLVLDQVQLEGKNSVSWNDFQIGYPDAKLT